MYDKKTLAEHSKKSLFYRALNFTLVKKLTKILSMRFSNGFRINSPIEIARLRRFAIKDNVKFILSDDELIDAVITCGTYFEGKVYIVSSQTKNRIKELADNYFKNGASIIFYSEFYIKNEKWLFKANIISVKMLILIFNTLFPQMKFTHTFFGLTDISIFHVLENEILRVWGNDILLTYKQLEKRLYYIPFNRIKYALGQNNNFIWNNTLTFSHISRIIITEEEQKNIRKTAKKNYNTYGYISIKDLPLNSIQERNHELSLIAVYNAVYRVCLSDKYDKRGKIISRKGDVTDALSIIKKYCQTIDRCSLDELLKYEKEIIGENHRWILVEAGNDCMVRIDKDNFVADKYVYFNSKKIDNILNRFIKDDYLPLKSFTTFGVFPDCGQIWNLFLLESYCRRFSKIFRFDTLSINSRNAGTIIRKSCTMSYTEIIADAVAKSGIELTKIIVGCFLFDKGYIGRSTTTRNSEIINKAKEMRERKG